MKRLLIISFDLLRENDNDKSYAIGSILSYLKNDNRYKNKFDVLHLSVNMFKIDNRFNFNHIKQNLITFDLKHIDYIAISAYIWNEFLTNKFIAYLKNDLDFNGKIILGGYQISYSNNPENEYPESDYFVSGYAEKALLNFITTENNTKYTNTGVDFNLLPLPYLTNEITVVQNQNMVRIETKRGCPFNCSFCAHRDLTSKKVHKHKTEKVVKELTLFNEKNVKKVNIIDPIFNFGENYLEILEEMVKINFKPLVSLQARFETIKGKKGKKFLDLCEKLNVNLEFGLQTAIYSESELINRKNNINEVKRTMRELNDRNIKYEVSLIYGLPTQTLDSFKYSIDFVKNNGCSKITAFPLMLLKGTELFTQKDKYRFVEKNKGIFNIPVVVESNSFSESEWNKMDKIANQLNPKNRI